MLAWMHKWACPISWEGPGKSDRPAHPLSEFLQTCLATLGGTFLCGAVLGTTMRGLGVVVPDDIVKSFLQAALATTLTLFVATEVRDTRTQGNHGSHDVSDFVLRFVASFTLLASALTAATFCFSAELTTLVLTVPTGFLFCTLFAAVRPDRGPLTQLMAKRELVELNPVCDRLRNSLGHPGRLPSSKSLFKTWSALSLIPGLVVLAVSSGWLPTDDETIENALISFSMTYLLTFMWFLQADAIMHLRAFAGVRTYGEIAFHCTSLVFMLILQVLFLALGLGVLWYGLIVANPVLSSRWLIAVPALVLPPLSGLSFWGLPSPRLAALSTITDLDARIRKLRRRLDYYSRGTG